MFRRHGWFQQTNVCGWIFFSLADLQNHSHFASFEPWRQENVDDKIYEKWQNLLCLNEKTLVAFNSSSSRIDADGSKLGANLCRNQISTQNYIFIQYSSISRDDWCQPIKEMAELNDIITDCTFKIVYIQNKVFFTPHSDKIHLKTWTCLADSLTQALR